ncbi:DUF4492 domain-containing protein [Porphyromonas sp.]
MSSDQANFFVRAFRLYRDGFRGLTPTSKKLWLIIAIKLFIMFAVLRAFFFPNFVKQQASERHVEKSEVVGDELIQRRAVDSVSGHEAGRP